MSVFEILTPAFLDELPLTEPEAAFPHFWVSPSRVSSTRRSPSELQAK